MHNAARAGISVNEFWHLTFAEMSISARAYVQVEESKLLTLAWLTERLRREKSLRPLQHYLTPERIKQRSDPGELERLKTEHEKLAQELTNGRR